ncbi:MAG: dephospho-CoA kinase [Treponema sp.]|jgi:dephospho-CoA kinase|nr:dephospho-CoA kinase [Treponema sp.]
MLIGLTGLYSAGKNHVAVLLEKKGLLVLDVDKLGHAAIENRKADICARFGNDILNPDDSVNRRLLGEKVFGKEGELNALEAIVHPEANRLTEEWVAAHDGKTCVINAALLHKSVVFSRLDCIIIVSAPWLVRLIRAKRRDKLPWTLLLKRFSSQKQYKAQYLAGNADIYKVENPGLERSGWAGLGFHPGCHSGCHLECQIDAILSKLGAGT